jgi:hypothetical protein
MNIQMRFESPMCTNQKKPRISWGRCGAKEVHMERKIGFFKDRLG